MKALHKALKPRTDHGRPSHHQQQRPRPAKARAHAPGSREGTAWPIQPSTAGPSHSIILQMKTCSVPNCDAKTDARGLCRKHYQRWKAHGDPLYQRTFPGSVSSYGYRVHSSKGRREFEHKLVVERALGHPLPPGAEIHHVNENKLDNRPENLVVCPNHAYHALLHVRSAALAATGNPNLRRCCICKGYDKPENLIFYRSGGGESGRHAQCQRDAANARYQRKKETQ